MANIMAARWTRLYRGTKSELAIEPAIAALGVPYRNNFPGFLYGVRSFPDFFLPTLGLVIEIDDDSHRRKVEEDAERTASLAKAWGVKVARCTNEEAEADPHGAVQRMLLSVGMWPLPSRTPPLAASLPQPKSAPKKIKREAYAQVLQAKRAAQRKPKSPASAD